jgi:hypothetical protein
MASEVRRLVRLPTIPTVSYGPFGLLEAVPWLMLASAMRFLAYANSLLALPALAIAMMSLFLAFLLATRRMIEFADGSTQLGKFTFEDQVSLAKKIVRRLFLLLLAVAGVALIFGQGRLAMQLLVGFDGIAFDQFSKVGMIWSSLLAAIVLLMVVKAGTDEEPDLLGAFRELFARGAYLLPAVVAVVALQFGLTAIQGIVRGWVGLYWNDPTTPMMMKRLVYFGFVFGFAAVRLWVTLAILTFALRESYRRGEA